MLQNDLPCKILVLVMLVESVPESRVFISGYVIAQTEIGNFTN